MPVAGRAKKARPAWFRCGFGVAWLGGVVSVGQGFCGAASSCIGEGGAAGRPAPARAERAEQVLLLRHALRRRRCARLRLGPVARLALVLTDLRRRVRSRGTRHAAGQPEARERPCQRGRNPRGCLPVPARAARSRERTRNVLTPAQHGQLCAPHVKTERGACGLTQCPALPPCTWQEWSEWSDCPVTCGGGQRKRYREASGPEESSRRRSLEAVSAQQRTRKSAMPALAGYARGALRKGGLVCRGWTKDGEGTGENGTGLEVAAGAFCGAGFGNLRCRSASCSPRRSRGRSGHLVRAWTRSPQRRESMAVVGGSCLVTGGWQAQCWYTAHADGGGISQDDFGRGCRLCSFGGGASNA